MSRLAGLVKLIILTRVLSPGDFGLLGMALLVQTWLSAFTEAGISAALIQKKNDISAYLNTAWSLQLARGLGVAALLFILAPLGALLFGNPQIVPIVRTAALLEVMWAAANPAVVYLRRDLDFRRDVIWRLSGVLPGLATGVVLALLLRNVWALMFSLLAARLAEVVASYMIHSYRPRLSFEWSRAQELMRFGKWVWLVNVGGFLERQLDSLAAGKLLGATALGYYQVAQQIAYYPTAQVGTYAGGILFPAFSRAKDPEQLRRAFLSALSLILLVVIPAALFVSVFSEPLVRIGLGARWLAICPSLRVLPWAGVAAAVAAATSPVFLGSGQPRGAALAQWLKVALFTGLVVPLAKAYGLSGIALSVCLSSMASACLQLLLATRLLKTGSELPRALKPLFLSCCLVLLASFAASVTSFWVLYLVAAGAVVVSLLALVRAVHAHLWAQQPSSIPVSHNVTHHDALSRGVSLSPARARAPEWIKCWRSILRVVRRGRQRPQPVIGHVEVGGNVGGSLIALSRYLRCCNKEKFRHEVIFLARPPNASAYLDAVWPSIDLGLRIRALSNHPPARPMRLVRSTLPRICYLWHFAQGVRSVWRLLCILPQTMRLAALFRSRNYALIHCNNSFGWQPQVVVAAFLARKPLVNHCRTVQRLTRLHRMLASVPTHFVAINNAVAEHLRLSGISAPLTICHDIIDRPKLCTERERLQLRADLAHLGDTLLGTVSRLEDSKGIEQLLIALRMLRSWWPSLGCVIVGDGSKATALRQMAADLELLDRVHFAGFVVNPYKYYACIDICVCPSLAEGGPLTVMEALQMGCPVISTRVGQVSEWIHNGYNGLVVQPGDPEALAAAIDLLLAHPERRASLAAAAALSSEQILDPLVCARELDAVFAAVASGAASK